MLVAMILELHNNVWSKWITLYVIAFPTSIQYGALTLIQ